MKWEVECAALGREVFVNPGFEHRVSVHRVHGCNGRWFLSARKYGYHNKQLRSTDAQKAQFEALVLLDVSLAVR
jgi:hypothetical protein